MFNKWVTIWGSAISIAEHRPAEYAKDITLRYPVYAGLPGNKIKLTLDNFCGSEAVTISKVTIAQSSEDITEKSSLSCPMDISTVKCVKFSGKEEITIDSGKSVKSDELDFDIKKGSSLVVNIYLKDFTQMRSGVVTIGPLSNAYYALGDQTETSALDVNSAKSIDTWYFLSNIEVLTDENNSCVICYGDSITAQAWPDFFNLALKEKGIDNIVAIRKAASGTRLLRQYECLTYDSYGLAGRNRFEHEIQSVSGASAIIIQQGINDIIHPVGEDVNIFRPMSDLPTCDEMTGMLSWYISKARENKIEKVYLGTLLPIWNWRTYAPFREELKEAYNSWIRSQKESDGIVDFDLAVRDQANPKAFKDGFDSGDHLHPSTVAYRAMGEEAAAAFLN